MRDKKKQESVIQTQEKEQTLDTWGRGSSAVSLNKRMKLEISNRRKTYEMKEKQRAEGNLSLNPKSEL